MIEFNGKISEEIRQSEIKTQAKASRNRFMIGAIVSFVLLALVIVAKYILSETKPTFTELFDGKVTLFLLLLFLVLFGFFIVSCFKPFYNKSFDNKSSFSIQFDNDKITYMPSEGSGKREFNYSNLKKIVDEGSYFVVVSKEHNIRIVCEKDLLVQGSMNEFENYFKNIIKKGKNFVKYPKKADGKTDDANCQMLCKTCNREKSGH